MGRSLIVYFLLLLLPLVLLPIGAHRLLSDEVSRGRQVGRALLNEHANRQAQLLAQNGVLDETSASSLGVQVCVYDAQGKPLTTPLPADGRCQGVTRLADGRCVYVVWAGVESPGFVHARRLMRCELFIYLGCGFFVLLGVGLIAADVRRMHRAATQRLDDVAAFSHRLKTPLTSVSLCAELLSGNRLDVTRQKESVSTIVDEAARLNGIVDEVLTYVKESRRG